MPYTTLDAMKDEVNFLRDLANVEEKGDKFILVAIYRAIAMSHQRIINRVEKGLDYSLEVVDGEIQRVGKESDRKTLEEEYPALKKAAEQYDIMEKLVDSTPDD
jgi:DNA replicative helicase MCM subunit Mcm2 (Cdc46/Mcm family)